MHSFLVCTEIFTKIEYILDHQKRLSKFKRSKVIQSKFSNYNGITLEINNGKTPEKYPNIWKQSHFYITYLSKKKIQKKQMKKTSQKIF